MTKPDQSATFSKLLEKLLAYREKDYRSDPELQAARINTMEYVLQSTLEKLRRFD